MKITQECDYAIRIVLQLAENGREGKAGAKEISQKQSIPLRFTVKILRKLIQAGILKSYKGVNGGYSILKDSKDISLLEVVEAIDGPVLINKCLSEASECNKGAPGMCPVHRELKALREEVRDRLSKISFDCLSSHQP